MEAERAVRLVIDALDAADIEHMLTGALATNFYGIPRTTKDADVVVNFSEEGAQLDAVMAQLGEEFQLDPQTSFELLTASTRYTLRVVSSSFEIELFAVTDDPHMQERFRRKLAVPYPGWERSVWLPTAEDVVIQKLRWARPKDIEDARNVIAVQRDALDWRYTRMWCERHGSIGHLEQILTSLAGTL